ncbi:MAG TPA: oligosaccharide flippase family protein [Thiolinea sp.]|nr:oligosaccharide flippase family protein [Thiolinea sp.]
MKGISLNPSLIRQTLVSLVARFAGVGLNFMVIIILTRNLRVNEAGMILLMMTLVTGFALFSRIGVEQWLVRDVAALPDEDLTSSQSRYLLSSWRFLLFSSLAFMALWLLLSPLMQKHLFDGEIHTPLLLLSALGILFFNLVAGNAAFMKGAHRITESLLTQNALPATTQLLLLLALWFWFPRSQNYFWIYTLSLGLAAALSLLWLRPWWQQQQQQAPFTLKGIMQESLPLAPISWMAFLMLWADTLMTGLLLSNDEVALFSIAARLAFIVGIFLTALDATVYPRLLKTAKQTPDKLRPLFWQGTVLVAGIMLLSTALMALASKYLLQVFRPEYVAAHQALLILLLSQLVRGLSLTFSFMFIIRRQVTHLNILLFSALAVNIIANLILTPRFSIAGAASAGLLANLTLTMGVMVLFFHKRLLNKAD